MCWSTSLWTSLTEMSRLTHFVGQLFSRSQLVRVYSMLWLVLRSGGSPDTLCGLRPRRQVLVFGCNAKVNGKESSEQNVTSHLCSLMRPIGGHDTSASEKQQVTQNKRHLFFFFAGRVFVIYLFLFFLFRWKYCFISAHQSACCGAVWCSCSRCGECPTKKEVLTLEEESRSNEPPSSSLTLWPVNPVIMENSQKRAASHLANTAGKMLGQRCDNEVTAAGLSAHCECFGLVFFPLFPQRPLFKQQPDLKPICDQRFVWL